MLWTNKVLRQGLVINTAGGCSFSAGHTYGLKSMLYAIKLLLVILWGSCACCWTRQCYCAK